MNKICTSLEQSKKLIELGIDRKSSDMYYWCGEDIRIGGYMAQDEELDIPCWSLTALLDVYPMVVGRDMDMYCCWQNSKNLHSRHYDNPIDACYEMILKLKENNLI